MRTRKAVFAVSMLALLAFSSVAIHSSAQAVIYQLPSQNSVENYVNALLTDYDALVNFNDYYGKPNFNPSYFPLWSPVGQTFKVFVMQLSANTTGCLSLSFFPIQGTAPDIILVDNTTFTDATGGNFLVVQSECLEESVFSDLLISLYNYTNIEIPFMLSIRSADVTGNYSANAYNASQFIFNSDQQAFETTITSSVSSVPTTSSNFQSTTSATQNAFFRNIETFGNDFYLYVILPIVVLFGSIAEAKTRIEKKISRLIKERKKKQAKIVKDDHNKSSESPL